LPMLAAEDLFTGIYELPVVKRGNPSMSYPGVSGKIDYYVPEPINVDIFVSAADLNNLKLLGKSSLQNWSATKTDILRRAIRRTTEAWCGLITSGALTWPMYASGAWESYVINYGSVLSVTPSILFGHADITIADVHEHLTLMQEQLGLNGYGSNLEIWASRDVYNVLFALVAASTTTSRIEMTAGKEGVNIGGFVIKRRGEQYRNPQTKAMADIMPAKTLRMIDLDAGHLLPYAAVDDLDANLVGLPFFVKPEKLVNPSGYKLIAQSKPFPVVNVKGICQSVVLS